MAKEIRPLYRTNDTTGVDEIFYPATTTDAIAHPTKQKSLTNVLGEIENGSVYDISAAHNNQPYADLSAALGTGGANVPADIRRGGMSIKFIQGTVNSTDNKYVQYRLMADEWSTDTLDWERYNDITTSNQPVSDIDFSDEQGNILVRFQNGGIKAKNFDSSKNATTEERGLMSAEDKVALEESVEKLSTIEEGAEANDIETDNIINADLDFSDEQGNILVRFQNGGIKTKNFDSSAIKEENLSEEFLETIVEAENIDSPQDQDLDFSDEQGNVLVRFQGGDIKTKNFDSSDINHYADRPAGGYENFLVQVNTGIANNDSMSGDLQDSINMQSDRCILNLPVNYSPNGTPVTLIIACQSSGGQIMSDTTIAVRTIPKPQTLLAEGFAILQVNGTPGYTDGIETYGGLGTPVFLQSVKEAYKYVTKKYNIRKDGVLLSGWSQGGLKAWQIAANKIVPVKAAALYAPVLDLWKMMYAFADATNRERMCEQFGFIEKEANDYVLDIFNNIYNQGDTVTKPTTYSSRSTVPNDYEFAYILNNYEKWLGYDPICWGTSENIVGEQFRYRSWGGTNPDENLCFENVSNIVPCPIKIFVGLSDTTVTPNLINWYKMMSDNAGMLCHFRYYLNGTHNFSSDYNNIQVTTKYGGTITTNVPSWEGVLFLERFI